ncbi:hypothetical protein Voc01_060900 [Virgisporangium ochraceum]|uniref:Uncharacterized protein n=1 Tax=Virgisporangium ochraceum TaxID=65505 RepID=A0A8J4EE23_9ACTN|nr:hypothetical protein Voc01_060900 [Virgisporangium ochraceum]
MLGMGGWATGGEGRKAKGEGRGRRGRATTARIGPDIGGVLRLAGVAGVRQGCRGLLVRTGTGSYLGVYGND